MNKTKKIFFASILLFLSLSVNSNSEIINKVVVNGNDRITLETIVIFSDIEIGENYEADGINLIIKKLFETNFFSNIATELNNGILEINVKENPIINSIVFNGEKASKYKDAISEALTLKEKSSFISGYVKSDANLIKQFYKQLGYYFVEIDVEKEVLKNNRVNLIYTIDKKEKAKIAKIYFLGDKKIKTTRLLSIITSQESAFWKFLSRTVYLNKSRIELDKRLLKNYYKNKGYYEINISSSSVEYSEGEGFILTYSIDAGQRYKFKKFTASVDDALDQSAFSSLEKEFNKVIGEYYSIKKLTSVLEKIDKLSQQKELQFVNHRVIETLVGDGVEVVVEIFEGKKFIIERINVAGNNVTNDDVIRGEMIVDEGDPYSAILINKSINRLKSRGIFSEVEHTILEGSSPDLKILEIKVAEKATGEIMAGAGVGTDGTTVMASVSENNWLGKGVKFQSTLNLSAEKISGNLAVTVPNYKYSGNSVYGNLDVSSDDRTVSSGYKSNKTGWSLGTEFEQYEDIYLSPSISISREKIEAQSTASNAIRSMDGTFNNADFGYGITIDKRNQAYLPTAGYKTKFLQSLPILQDSSSILNGLTHTNYHAFSDDLIGSFKFFGRSIHGMDQDVRLTSRLRVPQNRLRGFNTRRVGPKDGPDWIGGNYITAIGFEAQLPNLLPEATKTDISAFIDTANVWGIDYDSTLDNSNSIRSSFGIAADINTVVGPLSFTIAQSITKANSDETETFNFRLGTSF